MRSLSAIGTGHRLIDIFRLASDFLLRRLEALRSSSERRDEGPEWDVELPLRLLHGMGEEVRELGVVFLAERPRISADLPAME